MTNTISPAASNKIFTAVRNADGWYDRTRDALVEIPTDALVEAAAIAYDVTAERFRGSRKRPAVVRVAWLTGNGILDESNTRKLAIESLCGWAHDQRMKAFSVAFERSKLETAVTSIRSELA